MKTKSKCAADPLFPAAVPTISCMRGPAGSFLSSEAVNGTLQYLSLLPGYRVEKTFSIQ